MKLPCYLVRELLPLYHDKVLGEQAAADVKEHLDTCADCRAALDALDAGTGAEQALAAEQQQTEAAALRKVKSVLRKKQWVPAVAVAVAIFAALFVLSRVRYTLQAETRSLEPSKKALAVSLQVSRWNELFHNGRTEWRINDVDPDVTEIYYFKSEDQPLIDEGITQQEDGTWVAEQIPEELHLLWRRGDDADAPPATPEAAASETATPEAAGR